MKDNTVEMTKIPECSFCSEPAAYDGKTTMGPWAYMCEVHYAEFGTGLGLGIGQRLVLKTPDPDWVYEVFPATKELINSHLEELAPAVPEDQLQDAIDAVMESFGGLTYDKIINSGAYIEQFGAVGYDFDPTWEHVRLMTWLYGEFGNKFEEVDAFRDADGRFYIDVESLV